MEAPFSQGYKLLIEKRLARMIMHANFCFVGMVVLSTIAVFATAYYPNLFVQISDDVIDSRLTNFFLLGMNVSLLLLRCTFTILASYHIWEFMKLINSTKSEVHKYCRVTLTLAFKTSRFWEWATFSTTLLDIMALGAIQELSCVTFFVGIFIRIIFLSVVNAFKTTLQKVAKDSVTTTDSR